ncbi:DEAD/DEAH box helicase [Fusobacterium sp.]|uniref:DEAD/DEAH box helicase n=1 Tax=Fusobacterium sp. TaxID=68766 RepID=UPI0029021F13|nr:DEAD/DEAH box helicase [Fusobacterium sp.]MDU1910075.1 DEAD/DEAH box helicase [Fusobacterium sp.]
MEKSLIESFKTSSINLNIESSQNFQHKLLCNKEEKIVINLRKELENCDEFIISVAFITEGGLSLILEQLKELENRNVRGKILTGDYLNFTEPKALKRLLKYKNVELKILSKEKFHAKGYFFRKGNLWTLIIGSSNLTQTALTVNFEWNLKINSLEDGRITKDILNSFEEIFEKLPKLDLEMVENYEKVYKLSKDYSKIQEKNQNFLFIKDIKPNFMQKEALENLKILRENEDKGLLISATGTGKTYLSAFDVKNVKPEKMLFIAHRKTILKKAKYTFESIIKNKKMAIYGEENIAEADYIFAMVQTLNKKEHLERFPKNYFNYIIIDEVHHSGAKTYQSVISYFKPDFLLGMTATPERSDDFDIYKLFDHNIAYEIRLYDALRENLLCPFHYFGVSDITIDGECIDNKTSIKNLTLEQRIDHIIEKSRYYGYSGEKLHGLMFVSRVEEANILTEKFNERGIKSIALTGEHGDNSRENAIEKLENGEIEYIITVDIFNEGIDIPCVNQIILLRPTESSIVYIQQLGRGLRKNENKEFVVVLDFIGNYEKNFLIPTAISQNNSFDKDFMKKFLLNGTNMIPGESSISFEEIVKERIFENINKTNFSTKKNIEHDFNLLEKQLGKIPMLNDFFTRNMIEPNVILKFRKDYDSVLKALRPSTEFGILSEIEKNFLTFLSSFFTPAKRIHEMIILRESIKNTKISVEEIENILDRKYKIKQQKENIENGIKHLSKEIFTSLSTMKEFEPILEKIDGEYNLNKFFKIGYENNKYFRELIEDLIKYNLGYVEKNYKQSGKESIQKYKQYTKQEGFWQLNLDFNNGYQVSGYTVFEKEKKVVMFVTMEDSSIFDNKFLDQQRFPWFSKNNRCLSRGNKLTAEGKIAENNYVLEIFTKKSSGESFYYLGQIEKVLKAKECFTEKGIPHVEYELKLKNEVPKELFDYLQI